MISNTYFQIQICLPWAWGIFVTIFWEIASACSSCSYAFDEEVAAWGDDCPPAFTLYTVTVPVYISTATVFIANAFILLKLKAASNRLAFANDAERRRNGDRIKRIVLQGICQDSTFLVETFMFNYAGGMSDSIMWWFICYSLAWELSHAIDGLIIFLFNARITSKGSGVPTTTKF
ncbi:unnamed protein product [Cylicocyclus nassatus]|uniref:7TM GPCR serpentine receptor class x (Srx) domain-containing protein n=1 Tax=Cylicocyclus nassatus TaxID=53992 RepID=A0AA36DQE4_CYLNA|nr:unnamed protein product [Cylicocyclus nassatus]